MTDGYNLNLRRMTVGYNNSATMSTLTVGAGSTIDATDRFIVVYRGAATVDLYGTLNAGQSLRICNSGDSARTYNGTVNVYDGGVVNAGLMMGYTDPLYSWPMTSTLNILDGGVVNAGGTLTLNLGATVAVNAGGVLTLTGDKLALVDTYVTDGKLITDEGSIQATYNSLTDVTTVIPEPATLGLIAVVGASLLFVRRLMM
jgi:hypothetical protein